MSVRRLGAAVASALLGIAVFATPAAARVAEDQPDATVYGWTPDRAWATTAALLALAGVIVGGWAMLRSRRGEGNGRKGSMIALAAGLIALVNGVVNVAVADGGLGTGNGIVGGYVAMVLGAVAAILGWFALGRSRRTKDAVH